MPEVISATDAQRKVTRFVLMELVNQVFGDQPELSANEQTWSVPVRRWLPDDQRWRHIGVILVDAKTGELILDEATREEFMRRCRFSL